MNPASIADLLEPLRSPDAVGWWPPAPGWWLLAALALAALVYLARLAWRFHRRGAPLRAARRELAAIAARDDEPARRAAELARLQRRVAIRVAGRRACAGLTGDAWAAFLNALVPGDQRFFDGTLMELPYRPAVDPADCNDALDATARWLEQLERPR